MENKKHCYDCAYRKEVLGNCHIECTRDFKGIEKPTVDAYGARMGWAFFPMLFDPTWIGPCKGFSKTADHERKASDIDPLLTVAAILGSVGR